MQSIPNILPNSASPPPTAPYFSHFPQALFRTPSLFRSLRVRFWKRLLRTAIVVGFVLSLDYIHAHLRDSLGSGSGLVVALAKSVFCWAWFLTDITLWDSVGKQVSQLRITSCLIYPRRFSFFFRCKDYSVMRNEAFPDAHSRSDKAFFGLDRAD